MIVADRAKARGFGAKRGVRDKSGDVDGASTGLSADSGSPTQDQSNHEAGSVSRRLSAHGFNQSFPWTDKANEPNQLYGTLSQKAVFCPAAPHRQNNICPRETAPPIDVALPCGWTATALWSARTDAASRHTLCDSSLLNMGVFSRSVRHQNLMPRPSRVFMTTQMRSSLGIGLIRFLVGNSGFTIG